MSDGAEIGVNIPFIAGHIPEMRQKNIISSQIYNILDSAMGNLRRKTVCALSPCHPLMDYILREHNFDSQGMEKPGIQGIEGIEGKASRDSHGKIIPPGKILFSRSTFFEHQLHPPGYIIKNILFSVLLLFAHIGIFITPAAKHILMVVYLQNPNGTVIIT
ncbi:hypothetical protein ES705_44073 [subsurface metagenome]